MQNNSSIWSSQLESLFDRDVVNKAWARDTSIWCPVSNAKTETEILSRLGWLDLPETLVARFERCCRISDAATRQGLTNTLLLGMGGSSLGADVLADVFATAENRGHFTVLDSVHPSQFETVIGGLDLTKTLVIVASKSGTTLETISLFDEVWKRLLVSGVDASQHVVALTDSQSELESRAKACNFQYMTTPSSVGGRFSVYSEFGLLPAARLKLPVESYSDLLEKTVKDLKQNSLKNVALELAAFLTLLAEQGRDKLLVAGPVELKAFIAWIEQLIAESTGKDSLGFLPISWIDPCVLDNTDDCGFLDLSFEGKRSTVNIPSSAPTFFRDIPTKEALFSEFFVFELATALVGAALKLNPFDQPNVELTKIHTKNLLALRTKSVWPKPDVEKKQFSLWQVNNFEAKFRHHIKENDMLLIVLAFLPHLDETEEEVNRLFKDIQKELKRPVVINFGPRYLHSTGQWHKGGKPTAIFLQLWQQLPIMKDDDRELGTVLQAQVRADFLALEEVGRPVCSACVGDDLSTSLPAVASYFREHLFES